MLLVDDVDHVRTITLDRPAAMNAFSGELFDALTEALLDAGQEDRVRVVVLTGSGRAFSTGLDLSESVRTSNHPSTVSRVYSTHSSISRSRWCWRSTASGSVSARP